MPWEPKTDDFQPPPRKVDPPETFSPADRTTHGRGLKASLESAVTEALRRRAETGITVAGATPGMYVQFESQPGVHLNLSSLENRGQGIEVVAFTRTQTSDESPRQVEHATVFVPEGKVKALITRFEEYSRATPKAKGERRHEPMLDPVASLRLATLRSLWTDAVDVYPKGDEAIWWEVWLRRHDGAELSRVSEFAAIQNLELAPRRLQFDDRIVALVRATPSQLASSLDVLNDLAEVRRAKETPASFERMLPEEQAEWLRELLTRVTLPPATGPFVCILDTGVNRGHPLLETHLEATDCHTCNPNWGTHDHHGHGTEMAGLALFGDLTPVLASTQSVPVAHRLESVKLLPPKGQNPPDLYGAVTAEATSRVEIGAPDRQRCFSMAVAATDERDRGQPTSWSAATDALAAGRSFDAHTQGLEYLDASEEPLRRLFILSTGNVDPDKLQADHLDRSDVEGVHDPGQAWNALTVGAFTEKAVIVDPKWRAWQPVAHPGDLSPWSSTSVTFAGVWPIKPDVVFEGGNVVKNGAGDIDFPCPDLSLLSTHHRPAEKSFVLSHATSAATAQAARFAAQISVEYPTFWPETVRALMVHSARWTPRMEQEFGKARSKKGARVRLVRRYGFGVPHIERALRSASDSLTLILQKSIRPFAQGKMREAHFFELPWPSQVLGELGETPVQLRITLSYFIEPNPGRRGWQKRHNYASHGLRFGLKSPTESQPEFRKRLNAKARVEGEIRPKENSDSSKWFLGSDARHHGSLHSDIFSTTAANLADQGTICIYPVTGWWKEQPKRDRSELGVRYALIVSIETPDVSTDIWTPVAQQIGLPINIDV